MILLLFAENLKQNVRRNEQNSVGSKKYQKDTINSSF
jgi:hypothetical protein